jgi:uncharacterized protein YdeI (YjbR/CyaY-like superfamily)
MPSKSLKTLDAGTCEKWREWLAAHHGSEAEVWLIYYKRQTGRPSIAYDESVDEALCFGWIDSLIKRIDDDRYARKFTPRKPDSRWSASNRKRFAQLEASGRLTPAGLNRPPGDRSAAAPRPSALKIPRYIQQGLRSRPVAWTFFQSLAPSYRRMYIGWINSAKQPETKTRRLQEAVGLLAAGKKFGLK